MAATDTEARRGPRFAVRPGDNRQAGLGHRYRHQIRALPAALAELSKDVRVGAGASILDYGCADVPYRHFFPDDVDWVAADLPGNPSASLELNPDGTVPREDGSFDAVLSTQVLEHVEDPDLYLSECFRLLRPGGQMLLSTHGVFVYHPDPDDYWRWTNAGLRRVIERSGFEIERFEGVVGLLATGLQLAQDAVYWHLPRFLRPLFALVGQSLITLADRLQGRESRRLDAAIFAVVARKP